jgi:hypothetical protein
MAEAVEDVRVPTPWETVARWIGPPRNYQLTRWLILRLLGFVYVFAFLGLIFQGPGLLGSHGLTPVHSYVDLLHENGQGFWQVPSLFMWDSSDAALAGWAWAGLVLAIAVTLGYANLPMLLALWFIYGSYERVGQLWFSFGWEIQILETTLIAAFLAHPWDPRPLAARPPPVTGIVLMRWLVFRIMLGAGLIKLRGDVCWRDLTCLDWHFETQPIPNPLSPFFHHLPHAVHAGGVVYNHIVEVVAPFFVFGPRRLRIIAGLMMIGFQIVLILSGNLAFLNWLTVVPILACFDDAAILRIVPRRPREWIRARLGTPLAARWTGHKIAVTCFAVLVAFKSIPVVENLFAKHQAMNRDYDRLSLVNTYGAFGSVGDTRYELVIEGAMAEHPTEADWKAYELPCKPGDPARRPCILGPYHRRLDWLIWFSAMDEKLNDPWLVHLAWKLLDGDTTVRQLIAVDPFHGTPPRWIRIRRFVYHLQPYSAGTWWTRELVDPEWLQPVSKDTPGFQDVLARYRWPSPSTH